VEPKTPKSSEKGSKRIKAQKLRNARQILDLAIPDKIWPRSQKPKKNKGRHARSTTMTEILLISFAQATGGIFSSWGKIARESELRKKATSHNLRNLRKWPPYTSYPMADFYDFSTKNHAVKIPIIPKYL
jgi:hypothetical protein